YEQCVGVTYQQLHADGDAAIATIVDAYHAMAELCDVVVIVGSDYSELGQAIRALVDSSAGRIACPSS
ncbi:hypothetical protein, partial [Mycobacterium avium]|uniref:hypothetical protein n=1 Tax=Mycobacterium avium TaxID=1764 RepID=UPI00111C8D51